MQNNCDYESEIVISGMAGRFPKSANLDEFWQNLVDGTDMVQEGAQFRYNVEEFDVPTRMAILDNLDKFDAEFFSVHAKQAGALDSRIKLLLETTYEAIVDAGINPVEIQGSRTGVFVGGADSTTQGILSRSTSPDKINKYGALGNVSSMFANRLSYVFNLHGPSYSVDTACSSSSIALHQALQAIRAGSCDAAIVASSTTHNDPMSSQCFHQLKMTSNDGKCKAFDASADGYVRAEAAVALYICKRQVARRVYSTLVHSTTNNDGYKEQGITYPSQHLQEKVMRQLYKDTGISPLEVDYIEAHGTGTKVGDPQELAAITNVFCDGRKGPLHIGSVKSNMGHSEHASGLCGIAKVLLAHSFGQLPANLHYNTPNEEIPSLQDGRINVIDKLQPFNARYVAFNSMGFGGSNVHILMKLDPREDTKIWTPATPVILLGSGRTQQAVEVFLQKTLKNQENHSFVRLTHEISKVDTPRHGFRGYIVINFNKAEINVEQRDTGRKIWFIVTGLGSQWPGMARDLIKYETFRKSVETSAQFLNKNKFDLMNLLECGNPTKFDDFKNSLVSITVIQVALIDLLRSIGIQPDGIIGHSTGEVASGYADGSLTQEQAILSSLARACAFLESNLKPGLVASVGITWERAEEICPPGIYPAIHNAEENVTVAGRTDDIIKFTKKLEGEGVFVKVIRSAAFGFHSPLVKEYATLAKVLLEKLIPVPKIRSKKWLSTSIPELQWGTDLAKYCSADYYVNNGISPVYFHPTMKTVPEHVVVLEIGPHCFFQSILKKTLSNSAVILGLIHVKSPDNCVYFLESIGKCFIAGISVDVAALYEPVQFPVGVSTPNISSILRWDHTESYDVVHHTMEISRQKGIKFTFNLSNKEDSFLEGHTVDGKNLFPATGYVWLVWKCFAQQNRCRFENFPVVLENMRFERMTLLNTSKDTELVVNIFTGSGKFEITESDSIVCSGLVRNLDNTTDDEMIDYQICKEVDMTGPCLNKEDFYKEMHLRGYGHSGLFQGIEQAHTGGIWAKVRWHGEWVSFIDAVLQATLLRNETRDLYVPLRIQKLTINPNEIMEHLAPSDSIMDVKSWQDQGTITCVGMEFRDLSFAKLSKKTLELQKATAEQVFLPYWKTPQVLSETAALEFSVEVALDNLAVGKLIFTEILRAPSNMIGQRVINQAMLKFQIIDFCLVNNSNEAVDEEHIATATSRVVTMDDIDKVEQSLLYIDDSKIIPNVIKTLRHDGFILYKGYSGEALSYAELTVISEKTFQVEATECCYYLLRKLNPLPHLTLAIINVDTAGYLWVENAKTSLDALAEIDVIYFISKCYKSGINGLFKCLSREYTTGKLRCFHLIEPVDLDIRQPSGNLKNQLQKDLVFNIFKNNAWGTFCNLSISKEEFLKQKYSSIAYANTLTLGDLSSLSWIESPLKMITKDLIEVYFSSLNFKDVMLASGKIVQDSVAKYDRPDCIIGLEFSGVFQNRRVCGMGLSECLATRIDPTNKTIFDIPESWSFEDAATVPCVYITVYLALILRGKMQPGESVLIHAGSGGVGQAAIQVALNMNCRVFTTVSTKSKREFLKARFPALTDECFTNSREARKFECHIKKYTNGRGVDLVLNSLAQDKLHASIRCLATNGRFLEIGKFDILNDTKIGMSILAKGISIFGILADELISNASKKDMDELQYYISDGMKTGAITPLSYHVFNSDQLENAFRFMAQGKHIGKVLVQIKQNDNQPTVVLAIPRTYFRSEKSWIIVGGLGGMGFELANWIVERGGKNVVLSTRSGKTSTYHDYHINRWKSLGVNVLLENSDVSLHSGATMLLENAKTLGPIGGIFNVAVVLKDALFVSQSPADFQDVIQCKADASLHLDSLSRTLAPELDYFVVFSSIVAARGNPGQTSYGFANSVMERICEERWSQKLPALAIQWGAVGDVGVFHRTMKDKKVYGLAPESLKSCLDTLDLFLQGNKPVVSSFIPYYKKQTATTDSTKSLVSMAANILGIKDVKRVNPKTPLMELGLDSLMVAELQQVVQTRANVQLSQKQLSMLSFYKLQEIDSQSYVKNSELALDTVNRELIPNKTLSLRPLPEKPILEINSVKMSKDAIFVVHPIDGTIDTLRELVSQLEVNVYGIECTKEAPLESLEKLAGYYLNKIREIQPRGPYKLCGYSFGANVAFEMALQLESESETVSLLVMLDGSPRWKHWIDNYSSNTEDKLIWVDLILSSYLSQYLPTVSPQIYQELKGRNTEESKINYAADTLSDANPHVGLEAIRDCVCAVKSRALCGMNYNPVVKVKAKTVLLKALDSNVGDLASSDYNLGEICENAVEVFEIPGNHYCFHERFQELGIAEMLNKIIT